MGFDGGATINSHQPIGIFHGGAPAGISWRSNQQQIENVWGMEHEQEGFNAGFNHQQ
jgi:hypothetical protein